jgi:CBS domain-containing protein
LRIVSEGLAKAGSSSPVAYREAFHVEPLEHVSDASEHPWSPRQQIYLLHPGRSALVVIERNLKMRVEEILRSKPSKLIVIAREASLQEASRRILNEQVGMLLVVDRDERILGTLSERDLICFLARNGGSAIGSSVDRAMAQIDLTVSPDDRVVDVMRLMTVERARHLPVFDGDKLVGVISIGDILKSRLVEKDQETEVLRDMARVSLVMAA